MPKHEAQAVFTKDDLHRAQKRWVKKLDKATGRTLFLRNTDGAKFLAQTTLELIGPDVGEPLIVACEGEHANVLARILLDAQIDDRLVIPA